MGRPRTAPRSQRTAGGGRRRARRRRRRGHRHSTARAGPRRRRTVRGQRTGAPPRRRRRQRASRANFVSAAIDPAAFDRAASQHPLRSSSRLPGDYLRALSDRADYPDESSWLSIATADGLGEAMRGYGYTLRQLRRFSETSHWPGRRCGRWGPTDPNTRNRSSEARSAPPSRPQSGPGSWDPALVRTKAHPDADGWTLTRAQTISCPMRPAPTSILTVARSIAGPSLFAVDADAPGVTITELARIDSTRPLFTSRVQRHPCRIAGQGGSRRGVDESIHRLG